MILMVLYLLMILEHFQFKLLMLKTFKKLSQKESLNFQTRVNLERSNFLTLGEYWKVQVIVNYLNLRVK